jgi:hypothetical protein
MSVPSTPLEKIKDLGSRVMVPVYDSLTKTTRDRPINVFDAGAPRFPEGSPIAEVCNRIQGETREMGAKATDRPISKPSFGDLSPDKNPEKSPQGQALPSL